MRKVHKISHGIQPQAHGRLRSKSEEGSLVCGEVFLAMVVAASCSADTSAAGTCKVCKGGALTRMQKKKNPGGKDSSSNREVKTDP